MRTGLSLWPTADSSSPSGGHLACDAEVLEQPGSHSCQNTLPPQKTDPGRDCSFQDSIFPPPWGHIWESMTLRPAMKESPCLPFGSASLPASPGGSSLIYGWLALELCKPQGGLIVLLAGFRGLLTLDLLIQFINIPVLSKRHRCLLLHSWSALLAVV